MKKDFGSFIGNSDVCCTVHRSLQQRDGASARPASAAASSEASAAASTEASASADAGGNAA